MWPGMTAGDCLYFPDLVDAATAGGFRPLRVQTATRGEWEESESGYAAGAEEWLLANEEHPEAGQVRAKLDKHRSIWLRGHRDVLGYASPSACSDPEPSQATLATYSVVGK
jgi:hypothetical protein